MTDTDQASRNCDKADIMTIPYIVYEGAEAKSERTVRRLIILLAITIALLFATNLAWIYVYTTYEYETTETTTTVEAAGGIANFIGKDGDIDNGKNNSQDYCTPAKEAPKKLICDE